MPQDARNKLRQMGGIISSFPELIQAAQGPTAGGGVAAVERGAPTDIGSEFLLGQFDPRYMGIPPGPAPYEESARQPTAEAPSTPSQPPPSPVVREPLLAHELYEKRERMRAAEAAREATPPLRGPAGRGAPPPAPGPVARSGPAAEERSDDAALAQSMADRAIQLMQPPPDDDEKTLRERYDEQMALINEVFGEEKADNRAMDLAMIGLSILAAEGPNAINNIARGALSGLQSIGARRDAERERETALRTMALQGAIDQQGAAAQADADAAMAQFDRETDLLVQRLRNQGSGQSASTRDELYNSLLEKIAGDPETYGAFNEDGVVDPEVIKAIARQLANQYSATVAQQVASDLEANVPPDQIRQELLGAGHNPELYGL